MAQVPLMLPWLTQRQRPAGLLQQPLAVIPAGGASASVTRISPVGTYLYRYFKASRGERVRVAISWWSNADCPDENNCNYDRLDTDLRLGVKAPDGQWVDGAWSASWDNNYELVEFVAPQTGQYKIAVYKTRADETSNHLGIAWVKDAIYLPDLRNKDGWVSEFYVRNDGAEPRNVTIHYFDSNGNPTPKVSDVCALLPNQWCWIPVRYLNRIPYGTTGSAIVGGGEDVSVVVENQADNKRERTNYSGVLLSAGGSPGWEQAGPTLYAPVIKRQRYGRSSIIHVTNAGAQDTTVYVYYYDDFGNDRLGNHLTVPPNGTVLFFPSDGSGSGGCDTSDDVCSARVYADQPLVGVVQEYNDADGKAVTTHNLFSAGAKSIYFPIVKYKRYNMSTGLRIQNVGSTASSITVNFYEKNGSFKCALSSGSSIQPRAAKTFNLSSACPGDNFSGSAVATASQPLVGMANEVSLDGRYKKGYSSFQGGSHTAYGPLVYHAYSQDGYTWETGIAVQNLSTQGAAIDLDYYDADGNPAGSQSSSLAGRGMGVFFAPQSGFKGSVVITADRDIAAVVNVINNAPNGDTHAIYNASNR